MESFVRTYSGPPSLPFDKGEFEKGLRTSITSGIFSTGSYGSNPDFYGGEGDHYMERLCQQVTDHALSGRTPSFLSSALLGRFLFSLPLDSTERSGSAY